MGCKKDIRIIWTKNIIAIDTSELENVRRELTEERMARHKVEAEKARLQLAFQMGKLEMTRMERENYDMRKLNSTWVYLFWLVAFLTSVTAVMVIEYNVYAIPKTRATDWQISGSIKAFASCTVHERKKLCN